MSVSWNSKNTIMPSDSMTSNVLEDYVKEKANHILLGTEFDIQLVVLWLHSITLHTKENSVEVHDNKESLTYRKRTGLFRTAMVKLELPRLRHTDFTLFVLLTRCKCDSIFTAKIKNKINGLSTPRLHRTGQQGHS